MEEVKVGSDVSDVCLCECHEDGKSIFHVVACCDRCYEKYINAGGVFDDVRYQEICFSFLMNKRTKRKWKKSR